MTATNSQPLSTVHVTRSASGYSVEVESPDGSTVDVALELVDGELSPLADTEASRFVMRDYRTQSLLAEMAIRDRWEGLQSLGGAL